MKSGLTIREDNYSSVLDALKQLSGTDVLVGIPAGPPREDSPLSNAEIGYLQS
ncbi:bacteriophage protein, partial [Klebsiella pneumoniae]